MDRKKVQNIITSFISKKRDDGNFKGFELGLSGGIDSSLVLALTYEAVGNASISCQMLPYTKDANLTDAIRLASNFGVSYKVTSIKRAHDALCLNQLYSDRAKQNLMARLRMCYLYAEANTNKRLVLGTCNLSERMTGYFTKYGDGASDLEPLGGLLKTHVYELAKYWNDTHPDGPKIPEQILTKKPSANLYPGQTDEDEIGSYKVLDTYLSREFLNDAPIDNNGILSQEDMTRIKGTLYIYPIYQSICLKITTQSIRTP